MNKWLLIAAAFTLFIAPVFAISYVGPTPTSDIYQNFTFVFVNTTNTEMINNSVLELTNQSGAGVNHTMTIVNLTGSATNYSFINLTNLPAGYYTYKVWHLRNVSGLEVGATRNFTIDLQPPSITITAPGNHSAGGMNITLTIARSDNQSVSSCWYALVDSAGGNMSVNKLANGSLINGTPIANCATTVTFPGLNPNRPHNISVYVNDTAGNVAGTTVTFNATAFVLRLNIKNSTFANQPNVTISVAKFEGSLTETWSNTTNANGNATVNNLDASYQGIFQITVKGFNGTDLENATMIGSKLPPLPASPLQSFLDNSTLYVAPAVTIRISALDVNNPTANTPFLGLLFDKLLGFPVDMFTTTSQTSRDIVVDPLRNYTLIMFNFTSPPASREITNLTNYNPTPFSPRVHGERMNMSFTTYNLSGIANLSVGNSTPITFVKIVKYPIVGGMVPFDAEMDMQSQGAPGAVVDILNSTTGYYQLAIPGTTTAENRSYFIAVYASNNTANAGGTLHFGGFVNVSLSSNTQLNITLRPLAGSLSVGTNVNTSRFTFNIIDGSNNQSAGQSFVFATVNYTVTGGPSVEANLIINSNSSGAFSIPIYNLSSSGAKGVKLKIMSNRFAPRELDYTAAQITGNTSINVTLFPFEIKSPENVALEATINFMVSNSTCDVPYPNLATIDSGGCLLSSADDDSFNPLKALAMGKTSLRIQQANGVTLHYVGVDLLASGPPDAVYNDSSVASTSSSTNLAAVWRFGSLGPKIYDKVIIGMPYNESTTNENGTFKMRIPYFYDQNWNVIWNISANTTAQLPDGYGDYNSTTYAGYVNGSGITCSKTNAAATCYANTTNNTLWITIPHFSGTGPEVNGSNDLSGPTLSLTVPTSSIELSNSATISCSASDASGVNVTALTITKPDTSVVTHTCGSAFTSTDLLGAYTVRYNATDLIGNSNTVTGTFTTVRPGQASGSSGGGSSVTAPSKKVTHAFTSMDPGVVHQVKVTEADIGLKQIFIEVNNKANSVEITVQKLADKPATVTHTVSGNVFQYIEITHKNLDNSNIKSAKIRFNVTKSWITANNINESSIELNRYNNITWQKLATSRVSESTTDIEYEAVTPGFSLFAVTGQINIGSTTTTIPETSTTIPETAVTTTTLPPATGNMDIAIFLIVIVFIVAVIYIVGRSKK